jgi:hypothetical protein
MDISQPPSLWTNGLQFAYKVTSALGGIQRKKKDYGIEESDQEVEEVQEARGHQAVGPENRLRRWRQQYLANIRAVPASVTWLAVGRSLEHVNY